ncbi:unnamed protein product [Notodromas monacha]|uniref:Tumor susceptibility gene 101 protein n=1 Tax=Notodromas monacha TaxID=399045 RepID=A0A7R9BEU2_9CRUS|nr:unnamed protein product [Notodromas monacha]CAG0912889.1 unnamed protein product [Notodromas monacha]
MDSVLSTAEGKYSSIDRIRSEVRSITNIYSGLKLEYSPYVFNDGRTEMLLMLKGVIPVPISGVTYNIPVGIRLTATYPRNPPICSVEPTANMRINVSKYVAHDGRIYLPYLHEWKQETSDLSGLIQIMIAVFMETTPLNSVLKSPPQPPYPTQMSGRTNAGCPYPVQPFLPMPGVGGPASAAANPPYPTYSPFPRYPQVQASSVSTTPPYPPNPSYAVGSSSTITEEHRKASLLSAVEDKVRRKLGEIFQQYQAEMNVLKRTQVDLMEGERKIQGILSRLENEKRELEEKIQLMTEKKKEIEDALGKMEKKQEDLNVDDAVVPSAPLFKQIFELFAEENATQDAIYYLGEALRRNVLDLETYLKQVRELSRKQFLLRAHMQKCRKVARLAG